VLTTGGPSYFVLSARSGVFMVAGTLLGMGTSWYLYKVGTVFPVRFCAGEEEILD
jgi:hypothetical protein